MADQSLDAVRSEIAKAPSRTLETVPHRRHRPCHIGTSSPSRCRRSRARPSPSYSDGFFGQRRRRIDCDFRDATRAGILWSLLSGALGVLAGGLLLFQPAPGLVTLTYVLVAFFVLEGVATIMFALDHRRSLSGQWGFVLVSGLIDLFLAAIILMGLPGTAAWALGIIVGVNLLFGGASLIAMAMAVRSQKL